MSVTVIVESNSMGFVWLVAFITVVYTKMKILSNKKLYFDSQEVHTVSRIFLVGVRSIKK
jgi:hypothetical protein